MNINAGGSSYRAAVDVNEQTSLFQYHIFDGLDQSLFATVSGFSDGWHLLASKSESIARAVELNQTRANCAGQATDGGSDARSLS
jgi:hypothetical protein